MRRRFGTAVVIGAVAVGSTSLSPVGGPVSASSVEDKRSVWDGVFTKEQAARGRAVYLAQSCVRCHGETLGGNEFGPALLGDEFIGRWNDLSTADLFTLIKETMPQDRPGRLSAQQTADLLAYLLEENGYPAGQQALEQELSDLKAIAILKTRETPRP